MGREELELKYGLGCREEGKYRGKNRTYFMSIADMQIKSICRYIEPIGPDTKTSEIEEVMKKDRSSPGICVVDNGSVIGVVNRGHLNSKLSGLYGYCLYSRRSVTEIMEEDFLSVDYEKPIDEVAKMAMKRDYDNLYDFITVTKRGDYLGIVTVKDLLEKTMEIEVFNAKQLNPLTGLPGNIAIERELEKCIVSNQNCCVLYIDIDNFKAYNDVYGFENGDKIIRLLADILKMETPSGDFTGHIGGDDFVAVVSGGNAESTGNRIIDSFDCQIKGLYSEEDVKKGSIVSKNRYGVEEVFPIMSISIAGVTGEGVSSIYELGEIASRVKGRCKQMKGSVMIIER